MIHLDKEMTRPHVQMGQLTDVELCNNVLFLLHKSPESILSKSNDHFWCGLADAVTGNSDSAAIRLEQVTKDDPTYLGGLVLQVKGFKFSEFRSKLENIQYFPFFFSKKN